ncbi:MFS transporter [Streptomyces roseirectus]|uniref:MFS transporter n=1 Tax=Streptomyces roseirectus TaxID=2768066 RepID=A0A7H0IR28_9ACTN|nr:MFS transporter [Streptomyces roseirectus]QNP75244.1 MFS transporter [Streptomyces roseirectus]
MTALPAPGTGPTREGARGQDPRLWGLLFVLSGNMVLDALEVSVVLVALPTISADLGLSLWRVQWLMSGFALGFAALLVLGPWVNARFGRRRAYLAAMFVFALASVAGGLTDSTALLIATRVVKGLCAAVTAPSGLAIISTAFREPAQQRRAVSVYSLFGAAGFTTGLLLSGVLVEADWRWTFLFPAPIALLLLWYGRRLIPAVPRTQARASIDLTVLRDGRLVRAALCAAALNGSYIGLLLLVTFQTAGPDIAWAPWQTALCLLPACLPLALTVPFAGRLVGRFGTQRLIAVGALTPVAGQALYLWQPQAEPYPARLLPALLLVGSGFVLSFAALNMQATATIPAADRGSAVPLYQTAVQLSSVAVLPLVALLLASADSRRPALALITAVGAAGLLIALTGLRPGTDRKGQA